MSSRAVGLIITIFALLLVYVPVSIYYVWKLYSQAYGPHAFTLQSCIFLRKRYTSLSLVTAIAFIIQFFDVSMWVFVYSDWYNKQQSQVILVSIASSVHFITQFIITLSLTLRFWLIHFRMKFEMMSDNHEWKKIINSKYITDESQSVEHAMFDIMNSMQHRINSTKFILRYKSSIGNPRWCYIRASIAFILILIIMLFAESMNYPSLNLIPSHLSWIKLLLSLIIYASFGGLWSILLFLHCRSPNFNDSIHIKHELQSILQVMMFFLIIYIIFIVVFGLGLSDSNIYEEHFFDETIILFNVIGLSNMLMLYFIVVYPLKKAANFSQKSEREYSVQSISREQSITMSKMSKTKQFKFVFTQKSASYNPEKAKLKDVLRNQYSFGAFIQHLSSEFCIENLVSITEFLQFKLYVHRRCANSVLDKDLYYWLSMLPLDSLPRSEIVYENESMQNENEEDEKHEIHHDAQETANIADMIVNDLEFVRDCKLKARRLWFKYIKTGCDYEVNIAYDLRKRYRLWFDDEHQWIANEKFNDLVELRDIFDDSCTVTRGLINHSFQRFKDGKYFEKVKHELCRKEEPKALAP